MSKILVTGGAGFLGSNLCTRLINEGHQVICFDNLITGKKNNISTLLKHQNFSFLELDINNPIDLSNIDFIYNLACPASPVHYQQNDIFTIKTCTYGIFNIIELALRNNCPILHASTSEVYGDPKVHPQTESYYGNVNSFGPRSCYDEGKRVAESIIYSYKERFNLDARIIRIFNTYGPKMSPNDGRVVSNFITQALENKDITVYGDGSQTRSLCYVNDLIEGMELFRKHAKLDCGPINLGNPNEITVLEIAKEVIDITGSKSEIIYTDLPKDDPQIRRPDITKAKKVLGFNPEISLKKGLEDTIHYFKSKI